MKIYHEFFLAILEYFITGRILCSSLLEKGCPFLVYSNKKKNYKVHIKNNIMLHFFLFSPLSFLGVFEKPGSDPNIFKKHLLANFLELKVVAQTKSKVGVYVKGQSGLQGDSSLRTTTHLLMLRKNWKIQVT